MGDWEQTASTYNVCLRGGNKKVRHQKYITFWCISDCKGLTSVILYLVVAVRLSVTLWRRNCVRLCVPVHRFTVKIFFFLLLIDLSLYRALVQRCGHGMLLSVTQSLLGLLFPPFSLCLPLSFHPLSFSLGQVLQPISRWSSPSGVQ